MSKITNRDTTARNVGSLEHRLARLLDGPVLDRVVPHLPPETLHQLIRHRGLEACGELVASATPAQLTSLLDIDLWRPAQPGREQLFDVDRFGDWLEVLVDTDPTVAARTVAALDRNLVVAGLSRYVRVLDPGIFEPTAQSDDERTDRYEAMREGDALYANDPTLHDPGSPALECEVGGYLVRARRLDAWDAIIALLVALDAEHGDYFHTMMQGCRRLSNSSSEIDGLDDLLPAPEQHLHNVTIERERRRSQHGYATPADARAFLEMVRRPEHWRSRAATLETRIHPIVAAYFRAVDDEPEPSNDRSRSREHTLSSSAEAVMEVLAEAGMMPERTRGLLGAADAENEAARLTRLRRLMAHVRDTNDAAYLARTRELAFLANTLLAGCSIQSRPFTAQEASDAAASICNLGFEYWPAGWPSVTSHDTSPPDAFLVDHDLVTAFEAGWSVLHQEVSLFAADQLISTLNDVECVDRDIRSGLVALRRALVTNRDAGTPWRARDAAEILAMVDATAWIGVLGLLDECPVMAAALMAVLEGRTTTVSPTEFDFISTAKQIGDVRIFMRKLAGVLSC